MQLIEKSVISLIFSIPHQAHQSNNRIKFIDSLWKVAFKIFTILQTKRRIRMTYT